MSPEYSRNIPESDITTMAALIAGHKLAAGIGEEVTAVTVAAGAGYSVAQGWITAATGIYGVGAVAGTIALQGVADLLFSHQVHIAKAAAMEKYCKCPKPEGEQ